MKVDELTKEQEIVTESDTKNIKNSLKDVIQKNKNSEFAMKVKFQGERGETKWMNVDKSVLDKFLKSL